jgi:hypothetical protein
MELQEIIEKAIRDIVAEQLDNNDKIEERFARLEKLTQELNGVAFSHIRRFEALDSLLDQRTTPENLELRVARVEEYLDRCATRSQVKDIAFETVRDADLDVLIGSFVYGKIEEVLDDDEFRDRLNYIIDEKFENVEISLKVR